MTYSSINSNLANFMPDENILGSCGVSGGYTNIILLHSHLDKKLYNT
jgi:hypothetical protein